MSDPENEAKWIESVIQEFIEHSPANTLADAGNEKAWDSFLLGFSSGADPLYDSYKEHVGPFHWTPLEIFDLTFPGSGARAEDLTVISWILPQRDQTKADNRKEKKFPAERWARARIFGEKSNAALRRQVVEALTERGLQALAPHLSPLWSMKPSDKFVFASTWSERHAAFAAGLGTFGLCDGLITARGKAHRVGSAIVRLKLPPTPRPYRHHREYCLFYTHGTCKKCVARCPVGALSEAGHDKVKCRGHLHPHTDEHVKANYGFDGYGCGLCQTKVPCESKIPLPAEG